MTCDLISGRLRGECLVGRAGIKTLYYTKFNDFAALPGITESGGEITSLGADPIVLYQFDMGNNVGNFEEAPNISMENGSSFIAQTVTMTLFNIKPADLASLNALKKGRWTIWALDFQDKIRLFGRTRGMVATGGSDVSGAAPGDKKGLDLVLTSTENNYSPFMQDYSTDPFDNYANVTVTVSGYGPELATGWNTSAWWDTVGAGWTFDEGVDVSCDGTAGGFLIKNTFFTASIPYRIEVILTRAAGSVKPPYDGTINPSPGYIAAAGTYVYDYTPGGVGCYIHSSGAVGYNGTITSISIKEIL